MKKGFSFVLLPFLAVSLSPAVADNPTDDQLLYRFAIYTRDVYLGDAMRDVDPNRLSPAAAARLFSPHVLGYSLANLLRYAPTGSENHRIWLRLESRVKKTLYEIVELQAARERWDEEEVEQRRLAAVQEYDYAKLHLCDDIMAASTGVKPDQAPDFFASLTQTPSQPPSPPPVQPPADPPAQPPSPASNDAVAGVYRVTGKQYYDENPDASYIKLSGSMDEVVAEFKLFANGKATWDYKGTAKWDGRSGTADARDLRGSTQWLTYPDTWHGLALKITRGADGAWRAASISIGGNLFLLAPLQTVERPATPGGKTLTVKNSTAVRITVYLESDEFSTLNALGRVESRTETKFTGIPPRGRWYLKIIPSPGTSRRSHTTVLYVKEADYDYFFEVLEWHLR